MDYDIAIIGGGLVGYNAAERADANVLKMVLFEKQIGGGGCINEGVYFQRHACLRLICPK